MFAYIGIAAGALAAVLLIPLVVFFVLIRKCRESISIRGDLGSEGKKSWSNSRDNHYVSEVNLPDTVQTASD